MSFGDLNCEKHIIICLKYVGIVACICQSTVNSQSIYYTFVMTYDFSVLPRVSGYIFSNSTFVRYIMAFLMSFYSISLLKMVSCIPL